MSSETAPPVRLREADFDDHPHLQACLERNGLNLRPRPAWERIYRENPFRDLVPSSPIGWVLETPDRQIVGTYSTILSAVWWRGAQWSAGISASWAVDPPFRRHSLLLVASFFRQKGVDLLFNSSASADAGKIMAGLKARPAPHPDYCRTLVWVTNYTGFTASMLRKKLALAALAAPLAAPGLWAADSLRRRGPHWPAPANVRSLSAFDERFDGFWLSLRDTSNRLLSVRTRAALAWRFQGMLHQDRARLLVFEEHGQLLGYLVLRRRDRSAFGLTRYQVGDIQSLHDRPDVLASLMAAGLRLARQEGIHCVDMVGFNRTKQDSLLALTPRLRRLPQSPYFYKVLNPALNHGLEPASVWDPSGYDGDDTV